MWLMVTVGDGAACKGIKVINGEFEGISGLILKICKNLFRNVMKVKNKFCKQKVQRFFELE